MSKSLGNGIDPLEVIDKYGADALRLTLITGNAPGNDMRFYMGACRSEPKLCQQGMERFPFHPDEYGRQGSSVTDAICASGRLPTSGFSPRLNTRGKRSDRQHGQTIELGIAVQKVYDFIWDEFCDWYIEMVKPRLYATDDDDSQGTLHSGR